MKHYKNIEEMMNDTSLPDSEKVIIENGVFNLWSKTQEHEKNENMKIIFKYFKKHGKFE